MPHAPDRASRDRRAVPARGPGHDAPSQPGPRLPAPPPAGLRGRVTLVAAAAGAVGFWAQAALHYRKCVALRVQWIGSYQPWYWSC